MFCGVVYLSIYYIFGPICFQTQDPGDKLEPIAAVIGQRQGDK